ncbi:MAG TPA: hypothetical protein VGM84_19520 [Steroidobacteraceae bacterium]|jgi:hypothetical protein
MSAITSESLGLDAWENFYVIVGSSAAALTGLTFIVITIAADHRRGNSPEVRLTGLRAFITPTVVYFVTVLWLSALMTVPGQTPLSLSACVALSGVLGIAYCGRVIYWMFAVFSDYKPFLSDWIWNAILPPAAFALLTGAGLLGTSHTAFLLYAVGGVTLLLLLIGIHNAWDVVAWTTTERHARKGHESEALSGVNPDGENNRSP